MSRHLNYETLLERLSQEASFKFHFRLVTDTVHYYYLLIARNGNADDYRDFVIAVACEDNDVTARKIYENQLHSLLASITHAAGYFHLDLTDDKILYFPDRVPGWVGSSCSKRSSISTSILAYSLNSSRGCSLS